MTEKAELIARRGIFKQQLTKFCSFVNNVENEPNKINEIKLRLNKLEAVFDGFSEVQTKSEILDNSEAHLLERDQFENKYFEYVVKAQEFIEGIAQPSPSVSVSPILSTGVRLESRVILPELNLPEFCGAYDKWYSFRDSFKSLVHNDSSLSNVQKFHYLKSALKGNAEKIIDSLQATDANYIVAWELLQERFERKKVIIRAHIQNIYDLPGVTKNSQTSLRNFLDTIQRNIRALQSLAVPVEQWDDLLLFILCTKLDVETQKDWEARSSKLDSPTIKDFVDVLADRCALLEALDSKQSHVIKTVVPQKSSSKTLSYAAVDTTNCPTCRKSHFIYSCPEFIKLNTSDRYQMAKRANLCTNCLRSGHLNADCRSGGCRICKKRHSTMLHFENKKKNERKADANANNTVVQGSSDESDASNVTTCNVVSNNLVLLSTAVVRLLDNKGRSVEGRALLDSGSQSNFITEELCKKLSLKGEKINVSVSGFSTALSKINKTVKAKIQSTQNNYFADLSFLVIEKITDNIPQVTVSKNTFEIPSHIKLADPTFHTSSKIDMLIGAEIFYDLLCIGQVKLGINQPVLQKSMLGWIISGPVKMGNTGNSICHVATMPSADSKLLNQLEKFWEVEQTPTRKILSAEEADCEKHFLENFERLPSGRFSVKLPFRDNYMNLGESRVNATNRFLSLERKLSKNGELRKDYRSFMEEYIELGHMSVLTHDENNEPGFYMPHHGVINENSVTTKLRVVFDASAKTSTNLSLNDVLMVGPVIQDELFAILIRLRKHNIAITADLAKMYRQVEMAPEYRQFQKIIWRSDPSQELRQYALNTVTYGTSPASFLATRCLRQVAIENLDIHPLASQVICNDFYVDDLITGASDVKSAKKLISDIDKILQGACFVLRKWSSNDNSIFSNSDINSTSANYVICDSQKSKTLGVSWNRTLDIFEYNTLCIGKQGKITKRKILSVISQIFDPLGLVGPVVVRAKVLMQRLWLQKIGWDESVPHEIQSSWTNFHEQLPALQHIKIARKIVIKDFTNLQIHAFSDASQIAYGACVFARSKSDSGEIKVHLITAKSRVAPLKSLTTPRFELCGALLMVQLVNKTLNALQIKVNSVHFWTDSSIVIAWLATEPNKLKPFVAHRVAEIQLSTKIEQWGHVPTRDNPADKISRGVDAEQLAGLSLWWHGPEWLLCDQLNWPKLFTHENFEIPELKKNALVTVKANNFDIFAKYSSLTKLEHVVAYMLRFAKNTRGASLNGTLSVEELSEASRRLLLILQREVWPEEVLSLSGSKGVAAGSKLRSLNPFIDNDGLIRVGGRLKHSDLSFDNKFPIVLPSNHLYTKLVVQREHLRNFHSGLQNTLSAIRQRYWPLK